MEARVSRMPMGIDRIEVWADIIVQLSTFFQGATLFSTQVVSAIQKDPSFATCYWSREEVDTLFCPVEAHVEAAKSVRNWCDKALKLINREWGLGAEHYIRSKDFVEHTLKLVAAVANCQDVPDLKTGLLLANIQAVRRITEGLTFFSQRLFLTSDDWKQCKELLIPSQDLFVEELLAADVHINSAGEICLGRPLIPLPPPLPKADELELAGETILTVGAENNGGGQGQDNPNHDGSGKEEDKQSDDSGRKTSGAADKQARMSDNESEIDQSQPCRCHIFSQASPLVVPNNSSGSKVESEVGDPGNTLLEQAKRETVTPAFVSRLGFFQKKQLERWLLCRQYAGLQHLWYKDVLAQPCSDLVGSLGILGSYYYNPSVVCISHLRLLAQCCQLKTKGVEDLPYQVRQLWSNALSHDNLIRIANCHRDWFVPSLVVSQSDQRK